MPFVRRPLCLAMLLALAVPAMAADSTDLGTFKDWTAFAANGPEGRVCYVQASPSASPPYVQASSAKSKKVARDKVLLLISVWPGRGIRDEVEFLPGYLGNEKESVWLQVGAQRTEFFIRNDAKSGSAWIKNIADEPALVAAMRGGASITISAVSKKGTRTSDTFSLAGLGTALERIHRECK